MREVLPGFDFDDTVVMGSTPMYNYCHQKGFESIGIHLYDSAIRDYTEARWGSTHDYHIRYILTNFPDLIPDKKYDLEELITRASDVYMSNLENVFAKSVRPLEGTAAELGKLTVRPILATGVHPDILPVVLKNAGIDQDFFDPIVTAYDIPQELSKPHPYMLHKAIKLRRKKYGESFELSDLVYVGDSKNDMRMAYSVGATAIAVCTGRMSRVEIESSQKSYGGIIDYMKEDVLEVPDLINSIRETRSATPTVSR